MRNTVTDCAAHLSIYQWWPPELMRSRAFAETLERWCCLKNRCEKERYRYSLNEHGPNMCCVSVLVVGIQRTEMKYDPALLLRTSQVSSRYKLMHTKLQYNIRLSLGIVYFESN